MNLHYLEIVNLRNIARQQFNPAPTFNLFYGKNGSGKTSILEAIYLLGTGKSFRSHLTNRLVKNGAEQFLIHGQLQGQFQEKTPLGIEKHLNGTTLLRLNEETLTSAAKLAEMLPLQLINPDGFRLLEDGPKQRRQFLDWGVFHVEQNFLSFWQRSQRALQQRNMALRSLKVEREIKVWDQELILTGIAINEARHRYVKAFSPIFREFCSALLPEYTAVDLFYFQGWSEALDLTEALEASFIRDRQLRYTSIGIHRADLMIKVANIPAVDILSRGQLKLVICALRLAQGALLLQLTGKRCIYLLDDLAAELDVDKRRLIASCLAKLQTQVFLTSVDLSTMAEIQESLAPQVFHVELGELS